MLVELSKILVFIIIKIILELERIIIVFVEEEMLLLLFEFRCKKKNILIVSLGFIIIVGVAIVCFW